VEVWWTHLVGIRHERLNMAAYVGREYGNSYPLTLSVLAIKVSKRRGKQNAALHQKTVSERETLQ
jgi:hypothetical protein